jgi:hypothetical protein
MEIGKRNITHRNNKKIYITLRYHYKIHQHICKIDKYLL